MARYMSKSELNSQTLRMRSMAQSARGRSQGEYLDILDSLSAPPAQNLKILKGDGDVRSRSPKKQNQAA